MRRCRERGSGERGCTAGAPYLLGPVLIGVVLALLGAAAVFARDSAELPVTEISVAGHEFTVEIAATPEHRSRGLMYRSELPERHGMLFIFPDTDYRAFWMANTAIPLTLAYIDDEGVILELHELQPFSRRSVPSSEPARYALEVNRGELEALGIGPGDALELPSGLPSAR